MILFESTCVANLVKCSEMRRALRKRLGEQHIPTRCVEAVQLVFSEISANVIKHGQPAPRRIKTTARLDGTTLRLDIADDGGPFVGFDEAWSRGASLELTTLEISGRGLALVARHVEKASYHPAEKRSGRNRFNASIKLYSTRASILLVEDSSPLLAMYRTMLGTAFDVLTATSLQSAIEIARTNPVEAIIADYHLGDGDGTSLIEVLEEDETRPPAPIIILSGDHDPDTRAMALRRGVDRFLIKPVQAKALRTAVEDTLSRSRRQNARAFRYFSGTVQAASQIPATFAIEGFVSGTLSGTAALGSGDFLLNLPLLEGRRVILADVMGHGLSAQAAGSAFAAMLRTVHALQITPTPGAYLNAVSSVMLIDPLMQNHMMTLLVADIYQDGSIIFANAGHPRPLVIRRGLLEPVPCEGPLPGLFTEHHYDDARIKLHPRDRLILNTDGIDPRAPQSGIDCPIWLNETLAETGSLGFNELMAALKRATREYIGTESDDDWTIVALEHTTPKVLSPAGPDLDSIEGLRSYVVS